MGRRKKEVVKENNPSENWIINFSMTVHNRNLENGTEVSIRGERGRFQFIRHVYNPDIDVEWVDVIGGKKGVREMRSFRPDRIKRVHWKKTMRPTKEMIEKLK